MVSAGCVLRIQYTVSKAKVVTCTPESIASGAVEGSVRQRAAAHLINAVQSDSLRRNLQELGDGDLHVGVRRQVHTQHCPQLNADDRLTKLLHQQERGSEACICIIATSLQGDRSSPHARAHLAIVSRPFLPG